MSIRLRTVVSGALSFVPGVMPLYRKTAFRPNAAPAESSYGIWLKHLTLSRPYRAQPVPRHVIEVGPGASLGAGIAALICGAERFVALDAERFLVLQQVLPVFERLVELFSSRCRPENADGFPPYGALLDAAGFPSQVLPEPHMKKMLNHERIGGLRRDLQRFVANGGRESAHVTYLAPWRLAEVPLCGAVDFLFSHTVLQHVRAPTVVWADMSALLCNGGVCSHQINFDSHGVSAVWNGHWACPDALWHLALGRKAFLINREPWSRHQAMAAAAGLNVCDAKRLRDTAGIARAQLAHAWRFLDDDDLATRGAFLVARKDTMP